MACNNTNPCTCPNIACENHGICCQCIAKHKGMGNLPTCLRPVAEKKG